MSSSFSLSRFTAVIANPERLTHMESWHRHMPFAFAILDMLKPRVLVELGSHWGDSYCVFCQGVTEQKLPTRCYAVDTWKGDEHAGYYGDEVYEDLSSWHNPRYTAFSSLLRMTFDEALAQFPDGSVDLLHIDGLHTYDAVKHDFTTWLTKMSSRGVVLFHDTNVRHSDFGVWQLWAELADQYPSFEFPYGFGLGVLAVGNAVPSDVLDFLAYAQNNSQNVVDFFYRHGDAAEVRKKDAEIRRIQKHLNTIGAELGEVRAIAQDRIAFVEDLQHVLQTERERFLAESRQHEEQLNTIIQEQQNTASQLHRSLQLLQERTGSIDHMQRFTKMLLESRWWRLRNRILRLAGQDKRVLNTPVLSQPTVRWEPPNQQSAVTIIVPVYGGVKDTRDCIESILASSYSVPAQLVVINDASPEPELVAWLNANAGRFTLLHNKVNLGFVGTVNRGMALYPEQDVVLVNSDTVVANDWLDRLQQAAYAAANIGSVTPFSNNATICSYPDFCQDNQLPEGYEVKRLDALAAYVNKGLTVDIPTAVGFCMYIRRDCLHDAGAFDAELFGRGYGEENEFCMRSAQRGWRHVLTGDTFVYHKGGVSFAETQSENQRHGHKVLTSLYPNYEWLIQQYVAADPARALRFALDAARAAEAKQPVVLMVNHGRGGGSQKHLDQLVTRLAGQASCFLLTPEDSGLLHLRSYRGQQEAANGVYFQPSQHALLIETLQQLQIARIHFHHVIDLTHDLLSLPEHLACRYYVTVHDFYFACPQVTLADERGRYCGAPNEAGCNACLSKRPVAQVADIQAWRRQHQVFLQGAEQVYVPSKDTRERMRQYFPEIDFTWALHEVAENQPAVTLPILKPQDNLRVAVLGALSIFKGADQLEQLALQARKQRAPIELHLLGYAYRPLRTWPVTALKVHGAYQDEQMPELLQSLQPHGVLFVGSCPETWSYTLSSSLAAGLPVIAPDIGAFPERLAGRSWSWLMPVDSEPEQVLQLLLQVRQQIMSQQPPVAVAGVCAQAAFDYAQSYGQDIQATALRQEPTTQQWHTVVSQLLELTHQQPQKQLLADVRPRWIRKLLVMALHRGWLQRVADCIPYTARQRIKGWLTRK